MNSKHSFGQTDTNTLLRQTFVEFSSSLARPVQLVATPSRYIIKEYCKKDLVFGSEAAVVKYMRSEMRAVI